jgi:transcriptional regulator with XRE-family HTH domain
MLTATPLFSLFARRMKTARQSLGITQMELGVRAGIDESSASARINQYERDKHVPDFLTACNIAKVLDVPAAYFYTEDDSLAELISIYGQMKTQERKALLDIAESLIVGSDK